MNKKELANLDDESRKAPEILKGMIVSEVDFIRDTMQIVGMFLGESFVAAGLLLQEATPEEKKNYNP